jgi:xanthine dehydrogenase accessory factor
MEAADLDVLRTCAAWQAQSHAVLLVTVVHTWGSSPRPAGSLMALRDDGLVAGSVSGGCIEEDLIAAVQRGGVAALVPDGLPRPVTYGVEAEEAHRFGLPCGGTLQLVLEPLGPHSAIAALVDRVAAYRLTRRRLAMDTGAVELDDTAHAEAPAYDGRCLEHVIGPGFRLLAIGAGQLSRYLCQSAVGLGFEVTVCDPRSEYADVFDVPGVSLLRCMPDEAVQAMQLDRRCADRRAFLSAAVRHRKSRCPSWLRSSRSRTAWTSRGSLP